MNRTASLIVLAALVAGNVLTGHPVFQIGIGAYVLVFAVSLLLCFLGRGALVVRMELVDAAFGDRPTCRATLRNTGAIPLLNVRGKLRMANLFTGESADRTVRVALMPHGSETVEAVVNDEHPGKVNVSLEDVRVCDVLGLVSLAASARDGGAHDACSFTMVPTLHPLDPGIVLAQSESMDNDAYSPYRKGPDRSEVFQIREYEQGDNIAQIHWKLSSKMGKLIVKDGSLPIDRRLVVVADKSCREDAPLDWADAFAELVASLCASLVEAGVAFRVVHNDVANSTVSEETVESADELSEAVPQVLSSHLAPAQETCPELYGRLVGSLDASHVVCVSCRPQEDYAAAFDTQRVVYLDARVRDWAQRYQSLDWEG